MPKRSTLRLTKRIVERLKADGKDAIFWDADLAGFGVRVHTTGRKLFIVQSRGPAGLKRITLGRVGTETVDARRREAALVIDRIKRGEDPRPAPEPTVADLAERCLCQTRRSAGAPIVEEPPGHAGEGGRVWSSETGLRTNGF